MSEHGIASDHSARAAALDVSRSFIVQAPAGSGKTELLIQRYLALLSRVERPDAIVAMTFTRKAAGEIRERVIAALRSAEADSAPVEAHAALTWRLARGALQRDAALEWNLIAHPARLQVQTIDALCASLMRRPPLALKVGSLPRFVDRAARLYLDAARSELEGAGPGDAAWRRLLDHLDNDADRLVELIAGMLAKRDQWLQFLIVDDKEAMRIHLEKALVEEVDRELDALAAAFPSDAMAPLLELAQHAGSNLRLDDPSHPLAVVSETDGVASSYINGIANWSSIAEWLLRKEGTFRASVDKRQGFLAPSGAPARERGRRLDQKDAMEQLLTELRQVPGLAAALHSVRGLPPPQYEDASWSFIAALLDVLRHAVARLQLVFARENGIDYPESTLIALRALSSEDGPTDLLLALDMRIEHLLIDEFQDTSLAQHELVERLTEGWTPGDGRSLFVGGDPMQSIYRFREADVGLFLAAQESRRIGGVALDPLTLTRNFRSRQRLVDWVNATFSAVVSSTAHAARGTVVFKPSVATRDGHGDVPVTIDLCLDASEEAATVVSRVKAALGGDAASIAVLVRKRSDLDAILPALRSGGIAFSAVELDHLSERQTVLDLCSLTHSLVQPDDRLAWLACLRAPWCGLTLADLFVVAESCGKGTLSESLSGALRESVISCLSEDGRARFTRFADIVKAIFEERGRRPLSTTVRGAWLALGGPACIGDPIDLEASERFFALLAEHEVGADIPDWATFMEALEALRAEAESDPSMRVHIMTLHRAKGLEFDVVLMPGLTRPQRREDRQLLLWRRRSHGLLLAPMKSRYVAQGDDDPVYSYLRRLAAAEAQAELGRLLYVGCTRAKERLHLTSTLQLEEDDGAPKGWKKPSSGTALATLWPAISTSVSGPPKNSRAKAVREDRGVPLLRLPAHWRLPPPPSDIPIRQVAAVDSLSDRDPVEFDWARETARRVGTVAHRLLRRLAEEGLEGWTAPRIAGERKRVARELSALGLTAGEVDSAVEQVLAAIATTITDPRGRWLFDSGHAEAFSEHALTGLVDGKLVHLVLDRTFVAPDGVRWIVDFKLSRHQGADVEAFLDREQERYRTQLQDYAAVMHAIDARPIRVGLYFPLVPGWREWIPAFQGTLLSA